MCTEPRQPTSTEPSDFTLTATAFLRSINALIGCTLDADPAVRRKLCSKLERLRASMRSVMVDYRDLGPPE